MCGAYAPHIFYRAPPARSRMGNDREEERLPAEDTRIVQNKHGILLIRHRGGLKGRGVHGGELQPDPPGPRRREGLQDVREALSGPAVDVVAVEHVPLGLRHGYGVEVREVGNSLRHGARAVEHQQILSVDGLYF